MTKKNYIALSAVLAGGILAGCQQLKLPREQSAAQPYEESSVKGSDAQPRKESSVEDSDAQPQKESSVQDDLQEPALEILHFVDAFGAPYQVKINPKVKKHDYRMEAFVRKGDRLSYKGDSRYRSRLGVDVSYHNGNIDWNRVKAAGIEFVFLRIGYRGYGQAGNVCLDTMFFQNIQNARAAGLDVGVYFFSQAINEEEAAEEAAFVLSNLAGYDLQLPVVYDPESILDAEARTDNVSGRQFTKNTIVFCEQVAAAGYQPMIYSNMLWEAYQFKLAKLSEYPIWYADYEKLPQTPYAFEFWQYSNEGVVDGIDGVVDMDIQLIENKE